MKKYLLLLAFSWVASKSIDAQRILFNKVLDSVEVIANQSKEGITTITLNSSVKADTLWCDFTSPFGVYRIADIQLYKDRFAMIYYGYDRCVELVIGQWDGKSWQKRGYTLAFGWYASPCKAEILGFDKARIVQKGISTIVTVDTEKEGAEISRTVEKE